MTCVASIPRDVSNCAIDTVPHVVGVAAAGGAATPEMPNAKHGRTSSERHRTTPLVIISTLRGELDVERGMALGADAYLAKPFTREELSETCGRLLLTAGVVEHRSDPPAGGP